MHFKQPTHPYDASQTGQKKQSISTDVPKATEIQKDVVSLTDRYRLTGVETDRKTGR